jgi:hypothetical protein
MDLLGFFKERNDFLEIKILFSLKNPRPHRILRFRIGCGRAPCGSRAAGRPLAPAHDPAIGGADGCCEGRCVAWERSGGLHRIRADQLRSLLHVVPRAHDDPLRFRRWPKVFDGMPLRATAACHGLAGGEVPLRLGDWSPHDSLTGLPWGCWLEGSRTKGRRPSRRGRRRRGHGDGGVAVVLAPPSRSGNKRTCVLQCARGSVRARWLPVGVGAGRDGT